MTLNHQIQSIEPDDFNLLKKNLKRSDHIKGMKSKELIYFSYGFVKIELPDLMSAGDFQGVIRKMLWYKGEVSIQQVLPFIFWVYDELQNVVAIEKEYLSSTPDPDLINAGIERLNELGETNLIDTLANGNVLKWEEIKKLPYHVVFDKQRKMKLEADIQKDLARIQKDKSKQKKLH